MKNNGLNRELKLYSSYLMTMTAGYILQRFMDRIIGKKSDGTDVDDTTQLQDNLVKAIAWAALSGAMAGTFKMLIKRGISNK